LPQKEEEGGEIARRKWKMKHKERAVMSSMKGSRGDFLIELAGTVPPAICQRFWWQFPPDALLAYAFRSW